MKERTPLLKDPSPGASIRWPWLVAGLALALGCAEPAAQIEKGPAPQPAVTQLEARGPSDVTFVEQPTAIELKAYSVTWPDLSDAVSRLEGPDAGSAKSDLRRSAASSAPGDGTLNLLAQIERQEGRLDDAQSLIERAIAAKPEQHLHHFQQAMIFYARLQQATWGMERWKWHRRIKGAYRKAFELNPRPVPYRYYIAYTYLQEPWLTGGDKDEGLRLAEEGIEMGLKEFYVVRADAHRFRMEIPEAFNDYDRAIAARTFKLNSFLAASQLALDQKDLERARRYSEWGTQCRPDSPRTHEALGDYYAATGDSSAAARAYEASLQRDPNYGSAREKLEKVKPK